MSHDGRSETAIVAWLFVAAQPSRAILDNGVDGIPLIVGCNKDEGSYMADVFPPDARERMIDAFAAHIGDGDPSRYLDCLEELVPSGNLREKLVRMWYDLFRASALRMAEASTVAGAGGWVCAFEVPGSTPFGAAHGSDVAFTFNTINHSEQVGFHALTDFNRDIASNDVHRHGIVS
jgi:carboxylesterase type B